MNRKCLSGLLTDVLIIAFVVVLVSSVGFVFTGSWPSWWLLLDIIVTVLVFDYLYSRFIGKKT